MAWACVRCGAESREYLAPLLCRCGLGGSFAQTGGSGSPRAESAAKPLCLAEGPKKLSRVLTGSAELDRLTDGGWPVGATVTVYGGEGAGKSTLTYRWAAHLGPTLLVCPEMSLAMLSATARRAGANLANLHLSTAADWRTDAEAIGARAVVIDSLSRLEHPVATLGRLIVWAHRAGGVGFALAHKTAGKRKPKGDVGLGHDPDALLRVDARAKGHALVTVQKSRFCATGSSPLALLPPSGPQKAIFSDAQGARRTAPRLERVK